MPQAARLADTGSGHGCFPPTPIVSGSGDTSINGRPAARVGDPLIPHACGNCPPHGRSIAAGSGTVSINGKKAARVGDGIGCGGSVSSGSGDTLIGDGGFGGALKSCMEGASASGAAFVKVAFDAFPAPPNVKRAMDFTMALSAGPDALLAQVKGQAAAMVGAQLHTMQAAAFGPAVASLGIDPASLATKALSAAASGAPLQDALIGTVTQAAGGALAPHLAASVGPQLAEVVMGTAREALATGKISPEALVGSVLPAAIPATPEATALASAIGRAALSKQEDAAAEILAPALSGIVEDAAQDAVTDFLGTHEAP